MFPTLVCISVFTNHIHSQLPNQHGVIITHPLLLALSKHHYYSSSTPLPSHHPHLMSIFNLYHSQNSAFPSNHYHCLHPILVVATVHHFPTFTAHAAITTFHSTVTNPTSFPLHLHRTSQNIPPQPPNHSTTISTIPAPNLTPHP